MKAHPGLDSAYPWVLSDVQPALLDILTASHTLITSWVSSFFELCVPSPLPRLGAHKESLQLCLQSFTRGCLLLDQPHPPGSHSPEGRLLSSLCIQHLHGNSVNNPENRSINVCLMRERVSRHSPENQSLDFTKLKQLLQPGGCNILRRGKRDSSPSSSPSLSPGWVGLPVQVWEDKGNWLPVSPRSAGLQQLCLCGCLGCQDTWTRGRSW